jgi:hypothetical protein
MWKYMSELQTSTKSYLTEGDKVMIDTKEQTSSHMDKEEEDTAVRSSEEESSRPSIENHRTIKDQNDKESIDDNDIQEPTLPPTD